jgi:DNA-binding MarR family transcriptional regulator
MSETETKYELAESFGYLTGNAYRAINKRLRNLFKAEGHPITVEQFGILVHLWETDGLCQNQIGDIIDKDRAGVSRLINNLEKNDLIIRKSDKNDFRKKKVFLTENGKKLESCSKQLAYQVYSECIADKSESEISNAKSFLRNIKTNLN